MTHEVKITKQYETNDLVDLLSTAMVGCAYWCSELDYKPDEYQEAKARLKEKGNNDICYEEVLVEMLESGKSLWFCDDEEDEQYELTLEQLLNGIELNAEQRPHDCDLENGDAITADCIIQFALFNEVVFG